ncbi:MAG: heme exporter protein CcmB [Deltaproteobacteria bacterium]|nr:heme exporter protein CcmB [Deltaproteobacteria bacterium]
MNVLLAVLWKDLLSEWRSRDRAVAMLLFSLLVVVIFHFSLPPASPDEARTLAPGLLWVATVFAALLGLGRAFALELENDALSGLALAPADRGWIFLGKALANAVLIFAVQLVTAAALGLAFDVPLAEHAGRLAALLALGALGLAGAGTLFGAVAVRTRFRELVLPLLLLPLLVPVVVAGVRATATLLETGALAVEPLRLLLVTDAVFWIGSYVLFEFVLDE